MDTPELPLPPAKLRWGGPRYADDEAYVESGRLNARRLRELAGLSEQSRVVDIGCGPGRLLTGVLAELGAIGSYTGIDVSRPGLEWASSHLADSTRDISFHYFDYRNERYNPRGSLSGQHPLPVSDATADLVVLISVFSHMHFEDVVWYASEIARILAPGGRVYLTAFVETGVPLETENPEGYYRDWSGAMHCVRLNRVEFEDALYRAGLTVHLFQYRHTSDGQSSYVLGGANEPGFRARVISP